MSFWPKYAFEGWTALKSLVTTVATPHIGIVQYPNWRSRTFAFLGPRLLSRTGEQFYAVDKWSATGRSLLEVMADPGTGLLKCLLRVNHSHEPP